MSEDSLLWENRVQDAIDPTGEFASFFEAKNQLIMDRLGSVNRMKDINEYLEEEYPSKQRLFKAAQGFKAEKARLIGELDALNKRAHALLGFGPQFDQVCVDVDEFVADLNKKWTAARCRNMSQKHR